MMIRLSRLILGLALAVAAAAPLPARDERVTVADGATWASAPAEAGLVGWGIAERFCAS